MEFYSCYISNRQCYNFLLLMYMFAFLYDSSQLPVGFKFGIATSALREKKHIVISNKGQEWEWERKRKPRDKTKNTIEERRIVRASNIYAFCWYSMKWCARFQNNEYWRYRECVKMRAKPKRILYRPTWENIQMNIELVVFGCWINWMLWMCAKLWIIRLLTKCQT